MKREMKALEAKIKALREKIEFIDYLLAPDNEVGTALAEVEEELDKFRFK